MCNLYSITKGQQAIRDLAGAMRDLTGNLPMLPGVFPDYSAPIVRTAVDGVRELAMARWGMPSPTFAIAGADLPASHRRGLERGVDLGSRLFRCCVSYMLARLVNASRNLAIEAFAVCKLSKWPSSASRNSAAASRARCYTFAICRCNSAIRRFASTSAPWYNWPSLIETQSCRG